MTYEHTMDLLWTHLVIMTYLGFIHLGELLLEGPTVAQAEGEDRPGLVLDLPEVVVAAHGPAAEYAILGREE